MKIIAFAFAFFTTLAHATDQPRVINITTGQWPPYLDQSKRDQGCVAALIRDAFALHDIKVRFIFMPWQRAYEEGKRPPTPVVRIGITASVALWNTFIPSMPSLLKLAVFTIMNHSRLSFALTKI